MKHFYLLFALIFSINLSAQFTCELNSSYNPDIIGCDPITLKYIPDEYTTEKIIKVNFHFMLKESGDPLNFTETDDGNGNTSFTGYDFADAIISIANQRLGTNQQMNLPQGNNTPVLERKYSVILSGVYFHRDDNYYSYQSCGLGSLMSAYGVNLGTEVNIFWVYDEDPSYMIGGNANMSGDRAHRIMGAWQTYIDHGQIFWGVAGTFIHELGHNCGLHHTVRYNSGPCGNIDDCCSDTPSRDELIGAREPDPCCGWGGGSIPHCSNNMMDYAGPTAITPE